jgi:hypothetical protein
LEVDIEVVEGAGDEGAGEGRKPPDVVKSAFSEVFMMAWVWEIVNGKRHSWVKWLWMDMSEIVWVTSWQIEVNHMIKTLLQTSGRNFHHEALSKLFEK